MLTTRMFIKEIKYYIYLLNIRQDDYFLYEMIATYNGEKSSSETSVLLEFRNNIEKIFQFSISFNDLLENNCIKYKLDNGIFIFTCNYWDNINTTIGIH
jgi:hypothetical protein